MRSFFNKVVFPNKKGFPGNHSQYVKYSKNLKFSSFEFENFCKVVIQIF